MQSATGANAARLAAAFLRACGPRATVASALIALATLTEGVGLAMIAPFLGLLTGLAQPASPSWVEEAARWCRRIQPAAPLAPLLVAFGLVVIVRAGVVVARDRLVAELHLGFMEGLRGRLAAALAASGWARLSGISHARVTHALGLGVERCGAAAQAVQQLAVSLALAVVAAGVAVILSPPLALLAFTILAATALGLAPLLGRARRLGDDVGGAGEALVHEVGGFLGGLKLTLSHGRADAFVGAFEAHARALAQARRRFLAARSLVGAAANIVVAGATAAVVWIGAGPMALPAPLLLTILLVTARVAGPALAAQRAALDLAAEAPAFADLTTLIADLTGAKALPIPPALDPTTTPEAPPDLTLRAVVFRHPSGRGLGPLDLDLAAGEFLGVQGPSGAGKTTLADLVAGLVAPQSGEIRRRGARLDAAQTAAWRRTLAYVAQDSFLFHQSLRANLAWARPDADEADMWRALALAEAEDLVRDLPLGLDTPLGERGVLVSGGERQRIAFARAVLRRPVMLILDEALSAVDGPTEARITARLSALRPRPTVLMIAHRPQGLAHCDRIVRLADDGLVAPGASTRLATAG